MTDYDFTFKVMMLGDASVDKTSLTIRYISGFFLEDLKLTIGVDYYSKTTNFRGKKVKLQIWDFGGEERFRFLLSQYCKGANAAFFLYDITNVGTLEHLPDWTQIIREHSGDIPIILVGSKLDLEEFRAVPREEGILMAERYNLSAFIEVSAKTGQNVERLFEVMTEILFERYTVNLSKPIIKRRKRKKIKREEREEFIIIKKDKYILEDIPGIGPNFAEKLRNAQILSIKDLLNCNVKVIAKEIYRVGVASLNKWKQYARQILSDKKV